MTASRTTQRENGCKKKKVIGKTTPKACSGYSQDAFGLADAQKAVGTLVGPIVIQHQHKQYREAEGGRKDDAGRIMKVSAQPEGIRKLPMPTSSRP